MIYFFITLFTVIIDQVSKLFAVRYLKGQKPLIIIDKHFEFRYVENYGAAFGILQQKRMLFIIITTLVLIAIFIFLLRNYRYISNIARLAIALFLGGAIGNFIDRVRLGYVIDFIRINILPTYDFPVFNLADTFIIVGTILIIFIVIFDKYER